MLSCSGRRATVRHPAFARLQPRFATVGERAGAAAHRERLVADLVGRVVEVGAGSGITFPHYPSNVTHLIAVEPEPRLRRLATAAAHEAPIPVIVADGTADDLPLQDASMDGGVVSLVLCSVPDQTTALAELRRVLRPGGQLRFYEHVATADPAFQRRQRRADRIRPLLTGGCHLTRHTEQAIREAGFEIEHCLRFLFQPCRLARLSAPTSSGQPDGRNQ